MARGFGISFLLFALLAVGYEGFRDRERARRAAPGTAEHTEDTGVHTAEWGIMIPPNR